MDADRSGQTGLAERVRTLAKGAAARILPRGGVARASASLAMATALSQGLVVLASPALTRLYEPADFGALAVFVSLISALVVVGTGRYELATPLPDSDEEAAQVLGLALGFAGATALAAAAAAFAYGDRIAEALGAPTLAPHLWMLAAGAAGAGGYQALSYWAIRKKNYAGIARTRFARSIGQVGASVALGAAGFGLPGLLIGDVIGRVAGFGGLASSALKVDRAALGAIRPVAMRRAAVRYRSFPLVSAGSALLHSAATLAPPILFTSLYGPQVGGWFSLGQRVIGAPLTVIGQSVAQVFFGEASRGLRDDPRAMARLYRKTLVVLLAIGTPLIGAAALGGPWLFGLVFGSPWEEAGSYVRITGLAVLLQFAVGPVFQVLNVLERQTLVLAADVLGVALIVGGLILAKRAGWSAPEAVGVYAAGTLVLYLALLAFSAAAVGERAREATP